MPISRDAFLERVRQTVRAGNRIGPAPEAPARGQVGYQGAGPDPVVRFGEEFLAAGGHAYLVPNADAAVAKVVELVKGQVGRRILLGCGEFLDTLDLTTPLRALGADVVAVLTADAGSGPQVFFDADIGISGVHYLVAETGTIVVRAQPDEPRSLSLLPPVHIAVAWRAQLVPDLFDLFGPELLDKPDALPSCLSLITGPSKTGDIELRLVTGVHGPGELHLVLVTDDSAGLQAAKRFLP
jgi:L-lactate utilization protein LutC